MGNDFASVAKPVRSHSTTWCNNLCNMCSKSPVETPLEFGQVTFDLVPFAEGACREAYKGTILADGSHPWTRDQENTFVGWEKRGHTYPCVVKMYKDFHAMHAKQWAQDLGLSAECQKLAKEFNSVTEKITKVSVAFAMPVMFEVTKVGYRGSLCNDMKYARAKVSECVCIEPFLSQFEKLTSNTGWTNPYVTREDMEVVQAFSHWTWYRTGASMLVCDLQGTRTVKGWLFTDPAAHSRVLGYLGPTDLGQDGVRRFFDTHKCNKICECLDLHRPPEKPFQSKSGSTTSRKRTTFSWEVTNKV